MWQFTASFKSFVFFFKNWRDNQYYRSKCKSITQTNEKGRNHNVFAKTPPRPVCMDAYPPCFPIMLTGSLWQQLLFIPLPSLPPFLYSFLSPPLSLILFSSLFSVFLCVLPRLAPSINESKALSGLGGRGW